VNDPLPDQLRMRPVSRAEQGGRGVREQVLTLLLVMVLLVAVVAGVGALGVISTTDDVDALVDDLRPAAYTNIALRNDLTQAQAGARGWALTGDRDFLERFRTSQADAREEMARFAAAVSDDAHLSAAYERQEVAVEQWLAFGRELTRAPRRTDLSGGQARFDRVVATNDALSFAVNEAIDARGAHARDRRQTVMIAVALASLVGLAVTAGVCRSLVRRVSTPLQEMEAAVERLAAGDLGARVPEGGPREVRRVAAALNALAEENQRARDLESRVLEQLRRLDRAKDDFVSTVSHELRTPLTSISGYVELFEDDLGAQMDAHQRGMLAVIRRNVSRLRSLIEDLLTLSSVESEAFRTSFDPCDLNDLATDAVDDVAANAERAGVTVHLRTHAAPLPVDGDATQLSRAMLNLLSNAVKFSRPGGEVVVELTCRDGAGLFVVHDGGIGIPVEELATLGTRFYRASNAVEAEIGGTGLGLRIVQTIADNHGGRLELDSQEAAGTTVRLVLPLVDLVVAGNNPSARGLLEG
jgi:two-component system OmpR family sensor kinase